MKKIIRPEGPAKKIILLRYCPKKIFRPRPKSQPPPRISNGPCLNMAYYMQQCHFQQMWRRDVQVTTRDFLLPLFCIWTSYLSHSDCLVVILKFYTAPMFLHAVRNFVNQKAFWNKHVPTVFYLENMTSLLCFSLSLSCTLYDRNKKPLKTVWPDCKVATKFEKIDWEQA